MSTESDAMTNCVPAELLGSPLFLLVRMGFAIKARAMDEFERTGFSPYHHSVLALLDEGARTTQAAIADALQLDRGMLVGLLDSLEEQGLVERRRDPNDRRRHVVTLTAAGRRQLRKFRGIISGLEADFLAPLSEEDRAALLVLLSQMAAHYDPRFVPKSTSASLATR
jgi:MarR family transcriptional regulator, lower aerobic nicotinate degradation pathway regulator